MMKLGLITFFNMNESYIAKELCENTDKPEMNCHGKCFLKKNMDMANEAEKDATNIHKQLEIPVFITDSYLLDTLQFADLEFMYFDYTDLYAFDLNTKLFHPPLS